MSESKPCTAAARTRAGDIGAYAGPACRAHWVYPSDPRALGHSLPAHTVFGWCARERTILEEVDAWRLKYMRDHP